jgi:DNA-binding CsgD family transcriptional regulator
MSQCKSGIMGRNAMMETGSSLVRLADARPETVRQSLPSTARRSAELILAIGHANFSDHLADVLNDAVPHDIVGAYFIDRRMNMRVIFANGGIPSIADFPELASRHYANRFWRDDPAVGRLLSQVGESTRSFVTRQRWDEIPCGEYRRFAYERPNMLERVSLLRSCSDGCVLLSVYRSRASGQFSQIELEHIEHEADLLSAATLRHFQLFKPGALRPNRQAVAATIERWEGRLSRREVEVCSALLSEHSVKQAVRVLQMQTNTFLTYRKRAFAKLSIQSLDELRRWYERTLSGGVL